jgi:Family of unknown function (DUF6145)
MTENRIVLCGANAYDRKYYFNEDFSRLPQSIKDEIHIICVLFTEEVGGFFTMVFDEDGDLHFEVTAPAEDLLYDEIGSALLVKEIQQKKQELLRSIKIFYRVFVLNEDIEELMEDE